MNKIPSLIITVCFLAGALSLNSCRKKPEIPIITTSSGTNITTKSVTSGGVITADGGAEVTARGVCWATSSNPTVAGSHTIDGKGTGSFVSDVNGLLPNTLYFIRAYGTNSAGTGYGNEISFSTSPVLTATLTTTPITSITFSSAVSGGNITDDGGGDITARGLCWNTSTNPTTANSVTTDGAGTGSFVSNLTNLQPGTTYYVRSYATNSAGTAYGNELSFTTTSINPAVTTTAVSDITSTTAKSGGIITSDGGSPITARGVCWTTTADPTISNSKTSDETGTGSFTSNITALQPGTTYHVRAYAINIIGTSYGNDVTFTTAAALATVTTAAATGISQTSATLGGNVTANGGSSVIEKGVCWGTNPNPTTAGSYFANGSGNGAFTVNISGLIPATTYYVRAYAINSVGTAYGNQITFSTSSVALASLTTIAVTSITSTTAASGGNITSDGGGTITARGVCWGISTHPTISGSHTTNGTGTGNFASSLTGLTTGSIYYIRAYATNSAGTAYGNELKISTSISDIEGNIYKTVVIGTQLWMAENLKTTRFNDNLPIPLITDDIIWSNLIDPAYCWVLNDISYKDLYGAMYNWYTVETGKLCPAGWHVPSDNEFIALELYLGMPPDQTDLWEWRGTNEGTQMKSQVGWDGGGNGTNTSGFSALPGGYRFARNGSFNNIGDITYWWSSTEIDSESFYRRLDSSNNGIFRGATSRKGGKYIRCLKNYF